MRDEGTSHHYQRAGRYVSANTAAVEVLQSLLGERGIPYLTGRVWTTAARTGRLRRRSSCVAWRGMSRSRWKPLRWPRSRHSEACRWPRFCTAVTICWARTGSPLVAEPSRGPRPGRRQGGAGSDARGQRRPGALDHAARRARRSGAGASTPTTGATPSSCVRTSTTAG